METVSTLTNRLKEVLIDGQWVLLTYIREIENISWQNAITPVADLNSVAAIVWHIEYYLNGVTNVLKGGSSKCEIITIYSNSNLKIKSSSVSFLTHCTPYFNEIKTDCL